ncbi:hypothetical protein [Paraburkholderia adhaesiva]|uniref:hypothetical protein n=1 Tax=Paraburkholderia adhaesiva TaxID=2883244 RepID=UPI001F36C4C6|nr:hypothetical protein [Paraburkholderia adhaesiva]
MSNFLQNNDAATNQIQNSSHVVIGETRYVKLTSFRSKWLTVLLSNEGAPGKPVSICEYTKTIIINSQNGYTFFKIADGNSEYVGKVACISDDNVDKYLLKNPPSAAKATLLVQYSNMETRTKSLPRRDPGYGGHRDEILDQQWGVASIPGNSSIKVTLNSVWGQKYSPIPRGVHRIMAPENPHNSNMTDFYVKYAKDHGVGEVIADQVWFPIELKGTSGNSSRYVHIGNLSEGCVTVYDLNRWSDVYVFLISHRIPETRGKYVGYLEVK